LYTMVIDSVCIEIACKYYTGTYRISENILIMERFIEPVRLCDFATGFYCLSAMKQSYKNREHMTKSSNRLEVY